MGAVARPAGRLASVRRVDWRFLLPDSAFGSVLVVGPADDVLMTALEDVAATVARSDGAGRDVNARPDLVVTIAPDDVTLRAAIDRTASGGWIYVGSGEPRTGRSSLREVVLAVERAGLVDTRRSWHWPNEPAALEIVPLDDARAIRAAFDRRRSGRTGRLKAGLALVALRIGIFGLVLPGWSVVARRPDSGSATPGDAPLDAVRAALPGGRDTSIVLLTPRFRASRHVIGLVSTPASDGPAAVLKLPRLPGDDDGIRREAAALTGAARAGVVGVPDLIALHGPPRPALVESALAGVVIGGRDVRARPMESLEEIEAWTRALAGPPDRRLVRLRSLWAPALQRIALAIGVQAGAAAAVPAAREGLASEPAVARLVERTATILEPLGDALVPIVLEHGDLAPPNLLRLWDGGLGVVDWEVADVDGLPLGDLLFFAAFIAGDPVAPMPPGGGPIDRQAAHFGIELSLIPALAVAMWARWADRQLARFIDASTPFAERLPERHVRSWEAALARLEVVV